MLLQISLLFLPLTNCFSVNNPVDIRIDQDNPYAFYLFENFDLNADVFNKEKQLYQQLQNYKTLLSDRISKLRSENVNDISENILSQNVIKSEINETITNFPEDADFEGALRAMVLLFETYHFDLKESVRSGRIHIPQFPNGDVIDIQSRHNLTMTDLALFAKKAYKLTWYDVTILILRAYFQLKKSVKDLPDLSTQKTVDLLKKNAVNLNNQYLMKKRVMADKDFKVLPYVIGKNLYEKKKQPKDLLMNKPVYANSASSQGKQFYFRSVCNGYGYRFWNNIHYSFKCSYLHHDNPFLKLAPFKYEVASEEPFIIVIHELINDEEMNYLVNISKPNLSRTRVTDDEANVGQKYEFKSGKKSKVIHKTVQHWIADVGYYSTPLNLQELDDNNTYRIIHPTLFKLSKKLEIATTLNVTSKHASTMYQVTNYGLGGLCETHMDPRGYHDGVELTRDYSNLIKSGDMIATVMAWIQDAPVGGATAFTYPQREITVWPTKGSAAFWFNMKRSGKRDIRTYHGGCPVLNGSKWILNKWIYYYDQVGKYPCGLHEEDTIKPFSGHY